MRFFLGNSEDFHVIDALALGDFLFPEGFFQYLFDEVGEAASIFLCCGLCFPKKCFVQADGGGGFAYGADTVPRWFFRFHARKVCYTITIYNFFLANLFRVE